MRNGIVIGALVLALAACKGDDRKATGGNAQGEILPGSASDAMVPFDTVKSQAPLAPRSEGGAKTDGKGAGKPQDDGSEAAAPAEPAAAPPAGEEQTTEQ